MAPLILFFTLIALNGFANTQNPTPNQQPPTVKMPVVVDDGLSDIRRLELENLRDKLEGNGKYQDLRQDVLDSRESSIDWWLAVIGIFLAVFGIIVLFVARDKIKEFKELNQDAKKELKEIKKYKKQARGYKKKANNYYKKLVDPKIKINKQTIKEVEKSGTKLEKQILEARKLQGNGKIEEAIVLWQEIVVISKYENDNKQLSSGYFNLGYLYGELKEYQKAIKACQKAIKIKPDKHDAYYNMGVAYGGLGKHQEVIEACQKAIKIKPDMHEAYYNMGIAYEKLERYQDAINACEKVIEIEPDFIAFTKEQNWDGLEEWVNGQGESGVKRRNLLVLGELKGGGVK
ncbi:MAG: tetratricopeptide repeat protein [Gammaproteobacteria bacterium]|nr:tetratricopeptide repeat protein [Gammaproteobacteria bacterium]